MVTRLVGAALVRQEVSDRWTVTCVEYSQGRVRLQRRARLIQVVVGDGLPSSEASVSSQSYVAAACTLDGELLVAARSAPLAIAALPEGCRTRPAGGVPHDSEFPAVGERLILLSAAAFAAVPDLLGTADAAPRVDLCTRDPQALLMDLLGEAAVGSAAVIDHHGTADGGSAP